MDFLICVICLCLSWTIIQALQSIPRSTAIPSKLPPGPKSFPIIGNVFELLVTNLTRCWPSLPTLCRELTWILNLWETKKIEKIHAKENNHTHKTIFTWFGNLLMSTKLQGFHYYQEKKENTKYKVRHQFFFSHLKHDHAKTLITKLCFLSLGLIRSMDYLSVNLPLKTMQHYSGRVGLGRQTRSNKTRLHNAQHTQIVSMPTNTHGPLMSKARPNNHSGHIFSSHG